MPIGYWESEHLLAPVDLTVIGSGIVGMSTALHYKALRPGHRVRLIDRDVLGEGGTTRNAGFACFGGPGEWLDDLDVLGMEGWLSLLRRRAEGLADLVGLLGTDALGLQWTGGWELFDGDGGGRSRAQVVLERLEELSSAALPILGRALGDLHPAQGRPALERDDARAGHFGAELAVRLPWEGILHTGRMVEAFHRALHRSDIQCLFGCPVEAIGHESGADAPWRVRTVRGTLESARVAVCTNGFSRTLLPDLDVTPVPNRVLVVTPDSMPPEGAYHVEDGYLYFRTLSGGQVLFGGGRHYGLPLPLHPGRSPEAEDAWDVRLLQSARRWLGPVNGITHRWTGWLGVGENRQPLIGSTAPGLHHAVRMGGMGVAMGCGIGKALAHQVCSD